MARLSKENKQDLGRRSMSLGFIAQYAAEACLQNPGVARMDFSPVATVKASFGVEHAGAGVEVSFVEDQEDLIDIAVYPILYYGHNIPELAWDIQHQVKRDVENFTGLDVNQVNVQVVDVILPQEEENAH